MKLITRWLRSTCFLMLLMICLLIPVAHAEAGSSIIEDPALEAAIREQLDLQAEDRELTREDLLQLTSLYPQGTEKIKSLQGLEHAKNLESLMLPGNAISDLTPLADLDSLTFLALNGNQITDVCPIRYLTYLETLVISENQISNIDCLSTLIYVTDLLADNNDISDLTSLAHLPLQWLLLGDNRVTDLGPLTEHKTLEHVTLSNNQISDLSPLVTMEELRSVHADGNPLDAASVELLAKLEDRGITVNRNMDEEAEDEQVRITVDGQGLRQKQVPVKVEGAFYAAAGSLLEGMGFQVTENTKSSSIGAVKGSVQLEIKAGEEPLRLNGMAKPLEQAALYLDDTLYVPIRALAEVLEYEVTWNADKRIIGLHSSGQRLEAWDGKWQFDISHEWEQQHAKTYDFELQQGDRHFRMVALDKGLLKNIIDLKTYYQYSAAKTEGTHVTLSEPVYSSVNGRNLLEYTADIAGIMDFQGYSYFAILEGKDHLYHFSISGFGDKGEEPAKELREIVSTLQEFQTREEKHREKFGAMKPEERIRDAVRFYQKLGFLQQPIEGNGNVEQALLDDYHASYAKEAESEYNPFHPDNVYNEYADLYILEWDQSKVWLKDTEMDVGDGNDKYVETLQEWAALSRGTFQPTQITEKWLTEEGPVKVEFTLKGKKHTIYPQAMSDFLDIDILKKINALIRDTGIQFVVVRIDQSVFVTALTKAEYEQIASERYLWFETELFAY